MTALSVASGVVYAGGDFTAIGGRNLHGFAALDESTGLACGWDVAPAGEVMAITVDGAVIYIGGRFQSVGDSVRNFVAALDTAGGVLRSWNPDPNGIVATILANGNVVYIGGMFGRTGTLVANQVAALTPAVSLPMDIPRLGLWLGRSAPNPTRASTTIRFALPFAGPVTLALYDLSGREVARPLDGAMRPAGLGSVELATVGLKAGCYFYRLQACGGAAAGKLVVIR